jgi:hypothetical protein
MCLSGAGAAGAVIGDRNAAPGPTDAQKAELDRRLADHAANREMNLSVTFRRAARAEFIEAAAWYERKPRPGLGVEFIAEIERCVDAAAERPMTYAAIDNDGRRVVANRFPFSVYFRAVASAARSKSCRVFG